MRISDWSSDVCSSDLDEECAALAIFDIDENGAQETIALIGDTSTKIFVYKIDVGDLANVESAIAQFARDAGDSPDILVNNVGWDQAHWFLDTTPDFWDKLIHIN